MKIVLDPGHGGKDPGAVGPRGKEEEDFALAIAEILKDMLEQRGKHQVIMTRDEDEGVSLKERVHIANGHNADLFVSIHCNASADPRARGSETYYYRNSASGRDLARAVASEISKITVEDYEIVNRGSKSCGFYVVRFSNCPAVLVETLFVSNPKEETLLDNASFQMKMAGAIFRGIQRYLRA